MCDHFVVNGCKAPSRQQFSFLYYSDDVFSNPALLFIEKLIDDITLHDMSKRIGCLRHNSLLECIASLHHTELDLIFFDEKDTNMHQMVYQLLAGVYCMP